MAFGSKKRSSPGIFTIGPTVYDDQGREVASLSLKTYATDLWEEGSYGEDIVLYTDVYRIDLYNRHKFSRDQNIEIVWWQ